MGRADYLREGDFNRICDRCGFKWKASDTAKEWQGQITCPQCFEPRHPQDHVRGKRDKQSPPWTRPQKTPKFAPTDRLVHPFTAHLRFTGYRPSLLVDTAVSVGNASPAYTGHAPALLIDAAVAIGNASVTYTGHAPLVAADQRVSVGNASVNYTGFVPGVAIDQLVGIGSASASYEGFAPEALADTAVAVGSASASYAAFAPEVIADTAISIAEASASYTGHAPVVDIVGGGITLAFEASAVVLGETITGPTEIQSGDLLALFDQATGFSEPTTAVPSGFTAAQNAGDGSSVRSILSYKIADGSEADSSLTGMSGFEARKIILVFRPSSPLSSASHASGGGEVATGDLSSQSVLASNGTPPLVVLACYHDAGGNTVDPRTFSPAKDDEIENTATSHDQYFAYRIYNSNPQDTTVDMEDEGGVSTLLSTYIEVS